MEDAYSYVNWSQTTDSMGPWRVPPPDYSEWSVLPVGEINEEDRAASVSKSHSLAEKRRRDRINTQLGILRRLIPKSDKMDKAALLGCVIEHVKDLKQKATEVTNAMTLPSESDEITVDCATSELLPTSNTVTNDKNIFIKASVCCDDRPELFGELIRVLKGHGLNVVNAEIASVGGRVKSILVMCSKEDNGSVSVGSVKQSLNLVLSRISSSSSMPSNYARSKRQRFFLPSH